MAKILVVDDHPTNREFLVTLLGYQGHHMFEAGDGADALASARVERPDLIISDILMPTMDGYEFVRQLRADPAIAAIPVVFYTAHYRKHEAEQLARSCGVAHTMIKPCEPELVLKTVHESLGSRVPIASADLPQNFRDRHLRVVTDKLSQTADQLRVTNQRLTALIDICLQLASERDPKRMLENVCRAARDLMCSKYGAIGVTNKDKSGVAYFGTSGIVAKVDNDLNVSRLDAGIFGDVLTERRARRVVQSSAGETIAGLPQDYPLVHSALIAPIVSLSSVYGWICLTDKLGAEAFDLDDEELLTILAAQTGRIYENGSLYARLQEHSTRLQTEVVERRRMQEALTESESRFRQLAENIGEVFWLTNPAKNEMLYISPGYNEIWGRRGEDLYSSPRAWLDAIHPEDRDRIMQAAHTKQRSGEYAEEYRIVHGDGSIRWISDKAFPVTDKDGRVIRIAGVAKDITEAVRLREELLAREAWLHRAQLMAKLTHVITGPDGAFESWSETLPQLIGVDPAQMMKSTREWLRIVHPDDLALFRDNAIQAGIKGARIDFEYRLRRADGSWLHIRQVMEPIRGRAEQDSRVHWFNTIQDVTEQKQAEDRIRRLNRVYAVLSGINTLIVHARERDDLFRRACRIAVEAGAFKMAWIGIIDQQTLDGKVVAWHGGEEGYVNQIRLTARDGTPDSDRPPCRALRLLQPVVCNDLAADLSTVPLLDEMRGRGYRSLACLPLIVAGRPHAVIALFAGEADVFDELEMKLLTELADDIAFAMENIDRDIELARLTRIRAVSGEINAAIIRITDREGLFREVCRIAVEHGQFKMAWIGMTDWDAMMIVPNASAGTEPEFLTLISDHFSLREDAPLGNTQSARAAREKKTMVTNDMRGFENAFFVKERVERGILSMAILPLLIADEVVGVFALYAEEVGFFDEQETKLLMELASNIAFAIDHLEKRARLDYLAYYDSLTGLANRHLFLERVTQYLYSAASDGHKLAVFLFDLERFKNVNDSLGREAGDALLRQVAEWLTRNAGDPNLLARVGADHFALVMPEVKQEGGVARLLEKRMEALVQHPFRLNNAVFRIAAKVGAALFPDDGADADTLFRNAEAALKRAKARSERYLFYAQKMTDSVAAALTLENQLRQALDNGEFVLHYQPKVNLASGQLTGAEALIRWNNPRTGLVPPGRFIPVLEETGLIHDVGRWALRQAVADHLRWRAGDRPAVRIAVNASPLQLRHRGFVDEIAQVIGIDAQAPAGLELEITESLIMEDVKNTIASLLAIRNLGVSIAIDDFGTGFSSLSYLAKLPVDTLKIDRSFVIEMTMAPEGLALVSTIINLAHSLKLKVVAEGVETEEQSHLLRLLNCDEMQGFLFSKPVPAEVFEEKFLMPHAARLA